MSIDLYSSGLLHGTNHLSIGQEAVVVGVYGALEAAEGTETGVLDLRSLRSLDLGPVVASVVATGCLLVTHEAPGPAGVGAEVVAGVVGSESSNHPLAPPVRVAGRDNPMPYAPGLKRATIPQVEDVAVAARRLIAEDE